MKHTSYKILNTIIMKNQPVASHSESFEDLIFENRNKAYGAYDLNKQHRKFLIAAFLVSLTAFITAATVPFLNVRNDGSTLPYNSYYRPAKIIDSGVNTIKLPPPVTPGQNAENLVKYKVPEIVDEPDLTGSLLMPNDDFIDQINNEPVDPENLNVVYNIPPEINEPEPEPFVCPQEPATFGTGGIDEFREWVMQNTDYPPLALQNGIFGKVIVEFCVDLKGNVVDIKIIRGLDETIDKEVIRVLSSSPRWFPAKNGGTSVKQKFSIPVLFSAQNKI
jgi:periplasmic protein TonB